MKTKKLILRGNKMKAFVTYKLTNSEFSCCLYEQMNKYGFTCNVENKGRCKSQKDYIQ